MPTRARRSCPRCGTPTSGRCPTCLRRHRRRTDAHRPTPHQRGYTRQWRDRAKDYLARNPTCVDCGRPSEVPDHAPVPRRDLVAQGVPDPDADEHLQPRCVPCHNRRTARDESW